MRQLLNAKNFQSIITFAVTDEEGARRVMEYSNLNDNYA